MVALVVVVSERDSGSIHRVLILDDYVITVSLYTTSFEHVYQS